jgi:uncharacterized membrane protein YfcA
MFDNLSAVFFPISGVKVSIFVPPLVAFIISAFTSTGGISGAFLILPFQISYLRFTAPSVTSTNFVYNLVAIPSGVYRYVREGRMAWPLTWVVILGTLPGVFAGYYIRVYYLPDPRDFKAFVGCVLLYLGSRILYDITGHAERRGRQMLVLEEKYRQHVAELQGSRSGVLSAGLPRDAVVKAISVSHRKVVYEFWGQQFSFSTPAMFSLALAVGVIGGAYGIGGGAMIAPICVALFRLPVYTVAGAALMGTFLTSIAGVIFYSLVPLSAGVSCAPDWFLGILFGLGGIPGMYCGARLQKFVPQSFLKLILGLVITFLAASYVWQYFAG